MIVEESGILEKVDGSWNQFQNLESMGGDTNGLQAIHENGVAGLFDATFGNESLKGVEPKYEFNSIADCFSKSASKETSNEIDDNVMDCSNIEGMDTDVFNEQFCFSVEDLQEPIDAEFQTSPIPAQLHGIETNDCRSEQRCGFPFINSPSQHNGVSANDSSYGNIESTEIKDGVVPRWFEQPVSEMALSSDCNLSVSDLVWGKVNSHPWWPGQIYNPTNASEKAIKQFKKDSFLVAYFGDRSFAWNESSELKPFRENFAEIEKTSSSESFQNAVNSALNEVSKRVEYDLSCSCVGKRIHQVVDNAGIRTELVSREGFNPITPGTALHTKNLIGYVKTLASHPTKDPDRLDLAIAKSQLVSFSRFQNTKQKSLESSKRVLANKEVSMPKPSADVADCFRWAAIQMVDSPSVVNQTTDTKSLLYDLKSAAERPYTKYRFSVDMIMFVLEYRKSVVITDQEQKDKELPYMGACTAPKMLEVTDTSDAYWTDRVVENAATRPRRGRKRKSASVEKSPEFVDGNAPAELVMHFPVVDTVPSETNLNRMFRRFGPLKESDTEVDRDTNRARVVFKKSSDAQAAHGSASKFNIFGQTMVNYQLNYSVSVPFRNATNVEGFGYDDVALLLDF